MKAISLFLIVLTLGLFGCKRCYNCGSLVNYIECIKNGDTVYRTTFGSDDVDDTIALYTGMGYLCDIDTGWYSAYPVINPVCGKKELKEREALGHKCVDWHEDP